MLFRLPKDLRFFRNATLTKTLVMGKKTVETLPGGQPLKGRNTLILSRSLPESLIWMDGCFFARSFKTKDALLKWAGENLPDEELLIAGGEQIYRLFLDDCDELIMTEIEAEAEEADAFFPEYRNSFELAQDSGLIDDNGLSYRRRRYVKANG